MTNELALILGIVIVATTAIIATAMSQEPIAVAAIGAIVVQMGMGLLNYLKTAGAEQRVRQELADNTKKTVETQIATNGMKEVLIQAAHDKGVIEGGAAAAAAAAERRHIQEASGL